MTAMRRRHTTAANHETPDRFAYERELRARGVGAVAGVDEAGRGPLAGPVVAAAVVLPGAWLEEGLPAELAGLNDSKQLTAARREAFFAVLTARTEVRFGIAPVEAAVIDSINILQATHQAMNEALGQLRPPPAHALVDGLPVPSLCFPPDGSGEGRRAQLLHRRRQRAGEGDARPVAARLRPAVAGIRFRGAQRLRHGGASGGHRAARAVSDPPA